MPAEVVADERVLVESLSWYSRTGGHRLSKAAAY